MVSQKSRLVAFRPALQGEWGDDGTVVHVLNGKYYQTSQVQLRSSIEFVTEGLDLFQVLLTTENPTVGPLDGHLNQHAVDQVMRDLAVQLSETIRSP